MGRPATDKRERLINAAIEGFHRQGYARTSLADVAKTAGISTGNVFYYFKAKDDLAQAVIVEWCRLLRLCLAALDPVPCPWGRLEGFVDQAVARTEAYATLGCPLAGLTRDLRQEGGALSSDVSRIYAVQLDWLEAQFRGAGYPADRAIRHARTLMAGYHGSIVLAYAQSDTGLIAEEAAFLKGWLCELRVGATRA